VAAADAGWWARRLRAARQRARSRGPCLCPQVVMNYVGRLKKNGKIFDQTKGNKTFQFRLGVGEVIKVMQ
jgi:FKBP-type peptidyl-prolyl cis-trans isomerase